MPAEACQLSKALWKALQDLQKYPYKVLQFGSLSKVPKELTKFAPRNTKHFQERSEEKVICTARVCSMGPLRQGLTYS